MTWTNEALRRLVCSNGYRVIDMRSTGGRHVKVIAERDGRRSMFVLPRKYGDPRAIRNTLADLRRGGHPNRRHNG